MTADRRALGKRGEALAAEYLRQKGYVILERNYHTPYGEIDLVAKQGEALVFVEVKARRSRRYGMPEEAVTARKRQHLLAASQAYLQSQPDFDGDWRIDVIAVEWQQSEQNPCLTHFENAVSQP